MKLLIAVIACLCAQAVVSQEYQEVVPVTSEPIRPSMLSMLSKYIEANSTSIDQLSGSTTQHYGGIWLNATQRAPSGLCEVEEVYEDEITVTERIPYSVEVEVWCWSIRCTETETHYREEKRTQNVTKTRTVAVCCEDYEMDAETGECRPICNIPCENFGFCGAPNTCKCDYGYEGMFCEIDTLQPGVLAGPNVCEREEMREEQVRVVEQQLVATEVKEWCWPKIRCTKTKMEQVPVEKFQSLIKPHIVRQCCEGFAINFKGNRCIAFEFADDYQQQII